MVHGAGAGHGGRETGGDERHNLWTLGLFQASQINLKHHSVKRKTHECELGTDLLCVVSCIQHVRLVVFGLSVNE